jgi:hypothetical protein
MKKHLLSMILLILFILSGCIKPQEDKLSISLNPGVDTIEINSSYIDPGAKASYGFVELTASIYINTLDITQLGTYEIVYKVTYKTIEKEVKRIITVVDETPPIMTLNPGVDTILLGGNWIDAFVSVSDNSEQEVEITTLGEVDTQTAGIYIITYVATDLSGNESRIQRYVEVIDLNTI